ncbi:phenylacetic acid degradation protein [Haematobacter massiliensis]|uniref:Phenylacetic acid degradation protein n=1 Tax=Haematobacter massiliensis TaxID=195105 RepID=A0A086Y4N8_9RHOB|nr:PaaI family thioesterase [Haematobacter massiliensis]KFI29238.1 phenylacetic acid degradation protein [Haematobacter massiliensis]OWJ71956.1 phenylacetic acid degradation protein [Haematobacter massiliensis]OWJ82178.1 phenylacetic acid degradation protein [Haematobacter massiliensis]QBJ25855.1 PaaI family thioesterase [Haematobacter massiliensis]
MDQPVSGTLLTEDPYPFQKLLGFRMLDWGADRARFELPLGEHLQNRYGIPHGGVYAALLDTVMGYSGSYTGDAENRRKAMTLSLTTNFLSRPAGTVIVAEGWRVGGGQKTFFAEGRITDAEGTIVATGSGAFRYTGAGK